MSARTASGPSVSEAVTALAVQVRENVRLRRAFRVDSGGRREQTGGYLDQRVAGGCVVGIEVAPISTEARPLPAYRPSSPGPPRCSRRAGVPLRAPGGGARPGQAGLSGGAGAGAGRQGAAAGASGGMTWVDCPVLDGNLPGTH